MSGSDPSSSKRALVDTNVLVYAVSADDPRNGRAIRLLDRLMEQNLLLTSTQILQEFYSISTRKLGVPLDASRAVAFLDRIAGWPVFSHGYSEIREAAYLSAADSLAFRDALIVIAASRSNAQRLYTEDLQHGRVIRGVEIWNPFTHPVA